MYRVMMLNDGYGVNTEPRGSENKILESEALHYCEREYASCYSEAGTSAIQRSV